MAGRWVMASIQTSFAIMPAAVYWFGGLALGARLARGLDPDAGRVHDAADPALLPGRLAARRRHSTCRRRSRSSTGSSSTSTTRSTSRRSPTRSTARAGAGDVVFDRVWFRYGEQWTLEDVSFTVAAGSTTALVGETGSGKTTLGYLAARLYERQPRPHHDRRRRHPRPDASQSLADLVGVVSQETYLFHASVRENLRFAQPDATDEEVEQAAEAARIHDLIAASARGLRHGRRRARLPVLRRREAADRDRADDPAQPAGSRPRRGDELARHRDRARGPGGARPARRGPDDDRDRAPALDRPRRRPDRRPRPRPGRRGGSPRGADRCRRPLRGARRARCRARRHGSGRTAGPRPGRAPHCWHGDPGGRYGAASPPTSWA